MKYSIILIFFVLNQVFGELPTIANVDGYFLQADWYSVSVNMVPPVDLSLSPNITFMLESVSVDGGETITINECRSFQFEEAYVLRSRVFFDDHYIIFDSYFTRSTMWSARLRSWINNDTNPVPCSVDSMLNPNNIGIFTIGDFFRPDNNEVQTWHEQRKNGVISSIYSLKFKYRFRFNCTEGYIPDYDTLTCIRVFEWNDDFSFVTFSSIVSEYSVCCITNWQGADNVNFQPEYFSLGFSSIKNNGSEIDSDFCDEIFENADKNPNGFFGDTNFILIPNKSETTNPSYTFNFEANFTGDSSNPYLYPNENFGTKLNKLEFGEIGTSIKQVFSPNIRYAIGITNEIINFGCKIGCTKTSTTCLECPTNPPTSSSTSSSSVSSSATSSSIPFSISIPSSISSSIPSSSSSITTSRSGSIGSSVTDNSGIGTLNTNLNMTNSVTDSNTATDETTVETSDTKSSATLEPLDCTFNENTIGCFTPLNIAEVEGSSTLFANDIQYYFFEPTQDKELDVSEGNPDIYAAKGYLPQHENQKFEFSSVKNGKEFIEIDYSNSNKKRQINQNSIYYFSIHGNSEVDSIFQIKFTDFPNQTSDDDVGTGVILGIIALVLVSILIIVIALVYTKKTKPCKKSVTFNEKNEIIDVKTESLESDSEENSRSIKLQNLGTEEKVDYEDLEIFNPPVGKGAFGVVNKALLQETYVAIKTFLDDSLPQESSFFHEVKTLQRLRHPNIILYMGVCVEPVFCIITEFADNGSLYDLLHSKKIDLSWTQIGDILIDSAKGMVYLHSQKPPIIHRDVKSHNILVDSKWTGKIADFGISRPLAPQDRAMTVGMGTTSYMAPEILTSGDYSVKADVFGFGMILWECITRQIPYAEKESMSDVEDAIVNGERPEIPDLIGNDQIRPGYISLMQNCWAAKPKNRPNFKEITNDLIHIFGKAATV